MTQGLKFARLWGVGLLLALLLAACAGSEDDEASSEPATNNDAPAPAAEVETNNAATVAHRDAPIAVDAGFHNDNANVVGRTGRPQLVEFYTEW